MRTHILRLQMTPVDQTERQKNLPKTYKIQVEAYAIGGGRSQARLAYTY